MTQTQAGERVGAILSMNSEEVYLLGFGVYDGEHEPPFGPMGLPMSEIEASKASGDLPADWAWKNHRITLDDGSVVWGCQCWWGWEETIRERIKGLKIVHAVVESGE